MDLEFAFFWLDGRSGRGYESLNCHTGLGLVTSSTTSSSFFGCRGRELRQPVLPQGDFLTTISGTYQDWNSGYELRTGF